MAEQALWDGVDSWADFALTGTSNFAFDHVASPGLPYRGGAGRLTSNWSPTPDPDFDAYAEFTPGDNRLQMHASCAMRFADATFGGVRKGPILIVAKDDVGTDLGVVGQLFLDSAMMLYGANSDLLLDLSAFTNRWLIYDIHCRTKGLAEPYTVSMTVNIFEEAGAGLSLLKSLEMGLYDGITDLENVYRIHRIRFGFEEMDSATDTLDMWVDEVRAHRLSGAYPVSRLPPSRRSMWPTSL